MKIKIFALMATMLLLMGTTAIAQSNNTQKETTERSIKGDVNGDGVVDVADIAAVIAVMHEQGTIKQKYYWYVGQENPASIDTSNLKTATNEAGWHLIGTSTSGFTLTFNRDNLIEFDEMKQYYLVIPNGLTVYAADGVTVHATLLETTSNIPNHKTYVSKGATYDVKGVVIK